VSTRIGILGQEAGAQGVLYHPNDIEVGRHYLKSAAALRQRDKNVERLIPSSGSCEAEG